MLAASDPNLIIGGLALGGLAVAAVWRFINWIRDAPVAPDPWDAEVGEKLSDPDAVEVCPHCLTEQPPTAWFCRGCGRAVGPYNNLMPYVQIFSEGEVFRNGNSGRFRNRPFILIGYFLATVAMSPLFAPFYLVSLLLNWQSRPAQPESTEEQNLQP